MIGLEVRQAPPGLARFRPGGDGGTVALDRLRLVPLGSQRERDPQVQLCGFPSRLGIAQQPTVQADPGLIVTQPDAGLAVLPEVRSVTRIELEQLLHLLAGLHVLVLMEQRASVVGARGAIAGGPLRTASSSSSASSRNPRAMQMRPSRRMASMCSPCCARYIRRTRSAGKLPVSEQAAGLDDLRGQVAQRGEVFRDPGGVLHPPSRTGCAASPSWRAGRR